MMERPHWRATVACGLAFAASGLAAAPAAAHPHVWVNVETTVLYDAGKVTGFKHRWAFDDMYTAMAIQGLDKNKDGTYSREELAELAQVNIDGLKDFAFFTFAKLGDKALALSPPKDYWLEHKDGLLSLHMTLPLAEALPAETQGLTFAIYDQSFFIAFDLIKDKPVKFSEGAPSGCSAQVGGAEKDLAELQKLNDAFAGQMTAGDANMGDGLGYSTTIAITCAKT